MTFISVTAVIVLDQLTKFLVTRSLALYQSVPVIKGVFHLTLTHNRGAAFGIFPGQVLLFIIVSLVAVFYIYAHLNRSRHPLSVAYRLSLSLILAGAVGNLIDRVFVGYVIDFIDLRVWPVFNVADCAITTGALLLAWHLLRAERTI